MIFKTDAKNVYREVGKEKIMVRKTPPIEEVEEFWKGIWSNDKPFNDDVEWIKTIEHCNSHIEEQRWTDISTEEVEMALRKSHKLNSAGADKVTNFWLHSLPCTHDLLSNLLSEMVEKPGEHPRLAIRGIDISFPQN